MDPLRIGVRVVVAYVLLLALARLSGLRTVKHASPFDFTVALIVGDMVDDLVWAEVAAAQFVVGVGMLFTIHTGLRALQWRATGRT
jgi:uncharacterized membrane protein YcaP (DUF421 family)